MVGCLHETKWFGSKIYKVDDSAVLTSGGEVSQDRVIKHMTVSTAVLKTKKKTGVYGVCVCVCVCQHQPLDLS